MNVIEAIVYNMQETRRRSIKTWRGLPDEHLHWRPDQEAFSFGEMIRHVWTSQHAYHQILLNGGSLTTHDPQPYEALPITSVETEIALSETYFQNFIDYIQNLDPTQLSTQMIDRTATVGYKRTLGDMLLRIAYHDSVHTGQFLSYLRTFGLERPDIWD